MGKAGSMVKLHFEPATREDLDEIVSLEQDSFSAPWSRVMFEKELMDNQFGHLICARPFGDSPLPQRLLGYVCFWCVFDELRILNLAVHASERLKGVGLRLATHALTTGLAQGSTRALLEVRASNRPARALYERVGFHEYGRRVSYYTNPYEDAILMNLEPIPPSGIQDFPTREWR